MLEALFGNRTLEKVLFYLVVYGQGYSLSMAKNFKLAVYAVQLQLKRLEKGGIVVSFLLGKTRIYEFNPRYPFIKELKSLVQKAIAYLPKSEIRKYYTKKTIEKKVHHSLFVVRRSK